MILGDVARSQPTAWSAPVDNPSRRARVVATVRNERWVRAVRPHQWIKSGLVFAAPLAALRLGPGQICRLLLAALLACVAASGTYLLNDALDVTADRLHPVKRFRPIPAGEISRSSAVVVAAALLVAAPLFGLLIFGNTTGLFLGAYVTLTVAYSTRLKRIAVVDVVVIAAGFVIRVLVGSAATSVSASPWFLVAVGAAAVMVATGKRRGEVHELGDSAAAHRASLTTYRNGLTSLLIIVAAVGLGTGLVGWATIGSGGPRLEERWAITLVLPALGGVSRYVRLALAGRAARPETLVHDRMLLICSAFAVALFLVGSAIS
ncbi:MAG: UbiA family prenyltransferase [Ilumatobacteraceae bacterium]